MRWGRMQSVGALAVTAVPGVDAAEVVLPGVLVPEVPEGLEVLVLLLVGELAFPVSA